jgi:hypothetical protein
LALMVAAGSYVADGYQSVSDKLSAAMARVEAKDFDGAKPLLAAARADAEAVRVKAAAEKKRLSGQAAADLAAAEASVADARTRVWSAPRGRDTGADIEMMKADVAGLEAALHGLPPLIERGEYVVVSEKAVAIKGKAAETAAAVALLGAKPKR